MYESRGYWEMIQAEEEAKEEAGRQAVVHQAEIRQRKNVAKATHSCTVVDKEGWTTVVGRGR